MRREFSAGGVVLRRFRGRPFVVAVRPRPDVLALPKGHPDEGESMVEAATREVREETGLAAELIEKLGDVRYWYVAEGKRVFKVVSFYLVRYRRGRLDDVPPAFRHEVAEARWLPLEDAPRLLAYKGEREMVEKALMMLAPAAPS